MKELRTSNKANQNKFLKKWKFSEENYNYHSLLSLAPIFTSLFTISLRKLEIGYKSNCLGCLPDYAHIVINVICFQLLELTSTTSLCHWLLFQSFKIGHWLRCKLQTLKLQSYEWISSNGSLKFHKVVIFNLQLMSTDGIIWIWKSKNSYLF